MVDYSALINASARVPGAFSAGLQAGQARRREGDTRNALAALLANPEDQGAFGTLAQADPRIAMQFRQDQTQRNAQMEREREEKLKVAKGMIGQAALRIGQLPEEQRAAAWDAAIDHFVAEGYDGLEPFKGRYSEQSLYGVLAETGLLDNFQTATRPVPVSVVPGGRVEFYRPNDLRSGGQQMAAPAQVASEAEYASLPPGARYIAPDGSTRVKGGAGQTGPQTFP